MRFAGKGMISMIIPFFRAPEEGMGAMEEPDAVSGAISRIASGDKLRKVMQMSILCRKMSWKAIEAERSFCDPLHARQRS